MNLSLSTLEPDAEQWQQVLNGDRDAYEAVVAPFQDELLQLAQRQVNLHRATGQLQVNDLSPEEVVGEGLVAAYEYRASFDADAISFRAWLLGLQHRALARILQQEARYASRKAISLDEEVPQNSDQDAVGEALYEFRMPFDVTTYGDLIPGSAPADIEIETDAEGHAIDRLSEEERAFLEREDLDLPSGPRQVVLFHDEFELTLPEVAQILDYSLKDTASSLNLARTTLRESVGSVPELSDTEDRIDSYTGDPIP